MRQERQNLRRRAASIFFPSILLSICMTSAYAENITYTGVEMLQAEPDSSWVSRTDYLYPNDISGAPLASNNRVVIDFATGTAPYYVFGGYSNTSDVNNNTVEIKKGMVDWYTYGGYAEGTGNAAGNKVIVSGGTLNYITGGNSDGSGSATGNQVTVSGGTVNRGIRGGFSDLGSATNNSVTVSGGTVNGNIVGGASGSGNATGNIVTLSGGTFNGSIIGGYVDGVTGSATNNSVTLSGNPTFNITNPITDGWLFGGAAGSSSLDRFSNNTLSILNPISSQVSGIRGFQHMNLTISANGIPAIKTTELWLGDISGTTPTQITVNTQGTGQALTEGNTYTVIESGSTTENVSMSTTATGRHGIVYDYEFNNVGLGGSSGNDLVATVASRNFRQSSSALLQSMTARLSLVDRSSDLLTGQVLSQISSEADNCEASRISGKAANCKTSAFFATSGGSIRTKTGSHSDVDGFNMIAGATWGNKINGADINIGGFIEGGWGNYDSHNSYPGMAVNAGGDTSFVGMGTLVRLALNNGFYTDASLRFGRSESDFRSSDLMVNNTATKFDSESIYYGAHIGIGYEMSATNKTKIDLSSRYHWTRMDSDDVRIFGDKFHFNSADSMRLKSGLRVSHEIIERLRPYVGAYYDYEFDGEADGSVYGNRLKGPDVGGGTFVGELGLSYYPYSSSENVSVDFGVQGYAGRRDGLTGSLRLSFMF